MQTPSWKTTTIAVLTLIAALAALIKNFLASGQIDGTQVSLLITQILAVAGFIFAKDSTAK